MTSFFDLLEVGAVACVLGLDEDAEARQSEVVWRARTCADHLTWASILGTRALPPPLPVHDPVVRLAGAARPQRRIQGRGDLGAAARGRSPAPSGRPPKTGLGRPGPGHRARATAAQAHSPAPDRDAGHLARLAPAPDQEQVDLPECHRAPAGP